jgi:CHAT domain-containing protein/tetratricopeptide (TPR) repeat protein
MVDYLDLIFGPATANLVNARHAAESAVADTAGSAAQFAVLLDLAVIQILQADCSAAMEGCDRVQSAASSTPSQKLRSIALKMWAATTRWNLFPGGSGADAVEVWFHWPKDAVAGVPEGSEKWYQRDAFQFGGNMDDAWTACETTAPKDHETAFSGVVFHVLATLPAHRAKVRKAAGQTVGDDVFQRALRPLAHYLQQPEFLRAHPQVEGALSLLAADLAFRAQKYEFSHKLTGAALGAFQRAQDRVGVGACYLFGGDSRTGPRHSPATWHLAVSESPSGDSGDVASELHEQAIATAHFSDARKLYQRAIEEFSAANAPRSMAAAELRLGYLDLVEGNGAAAMERIDRAISGYLACGDGLGLQLARCHRVLAEVARHPALEDHDTVREIALWGREQGSYSYAFGLGLMLGAQGRRWLIGTGDPERALACFRLAQTLFRGIDAPVNVAQSVADQGSAYAAIGDRQIAAVLYDQADSAYEDQAARRSEVTAILTRRRASTLLLHYHAYEHMADAGGICQIVSRVRSLLRRLPADRIVRPLDELMGGQYKSTERIVAAGDTSPFALREAYEAHEAVMQQVAASALHWVFETGKVTAACYQARRAARENRPRHRARWIAIALKRARSAKTASSSRLEGIVYAHSREFDKALAAFRRDWDEDESSEFPEAIAAVMAQTGMDPGALVRRRLRSLVSKAATLAQIEEFAEADHCYELLAQEFGPEWWRIERDNVWEIAAAVAEVREHMGDLDGAWEWYRVSLADLERRRAALTRHSHQLAFASQPFASSVYISAARAAYRLWQAARTAGDGARAQQWAGMSLSCIVANVARALDRILPEPTGIDGGGLTLRQLNLRLTACKNLLADFRSEITFPTVEAAMEARRAVTRNLLEVDEALRRLEGADIRQRAETAPEAKPDEGATGFEFPARTVLLQYAVRGPDLLIWAVTRDGIVAGHRAAWDEFAFDHLVTDARQAWMACTESNTAAETLSVRLLEPMAEILDANEMLIVAPYGPLHRLPFQALKWRGTPLAATHGVTVLPAAALADHLASIPASRATAILIAGVADGEPVQPYVGEKQFPLPERFRARPGAALTAVEAKLVAKAIGSERPLVAEHVTRRAVLERIRDARLIHFAGHGILLESVPLLSFLALAGAESVTAQDLLESRLDADLVVLSGCSTGAGEATTGNDVLGLTYALLAAGARSAVVSTWDVEDVSSLLLMRQFYELLAQGLGIAAALRQAQLWLCGLTGRQVAAILKEIAASAADRHEATRLIGKIVQFLKAADSLPFAAPRYWAPFTCVGLPDAHVMLPGTVQTRRASQAVSPPSPGVRDA